MADEEFQEVLRLLSNDLQFGVLTALAIYETLNLKKISKLLGRTPSTVIHQIRNLLNEGYIELDQEETEERVGKYYKLTKKGLKLFNESLDKEFEFFSKELKKKVKEGRIDPIKDENTLIGLSTAVRGLVGMIKNLTQFWAHQLEEEVGRYQQLGKEIPLGVSGVNLSAYINMFNLDTPEKKEKLKTIMENFFGQMNEFSEEMNTEIGGETAIIETNQFVFAMTGPVGPFSMDSSSSSDPTKEDS